MKTGVGTPNGRACPRKSISSGKSVNATRPLEMISASPRAIPSMPRVTMKAGTRPLVMMKPLTAPAAAPAPSEPMIAKYHGSSSVTTRAAPVTDARPRTEPSDRSIPAELMTNVAPIARMPNVALARMMLKKLFAVRKTRTPEPVTGDRNAMMTISARRTASDSPREHVFVPEFSAYAHPKNAGLGRRLFTRLRFFEHPLVRRPALLLLLDVFEHRVGTASQERPWSAPWWGHRPSQADRHRP